MTNLSFDAIVQARIAFGDRRKTLIENWREARQIASLVPGSEAYWAECITKTNDAELAILGGAY